MSLNPALIGLQQRSPLNSSSYSSSSSLYPEKEAHLGVLMSRRSLRLDDGLLDRSLPHSSASFSVGGAGWRSSRPLKPRRSSLLSASCSTSMLLLSPRPSLLNGSMASDASLLSSLLDESSVQEATLVEGFWGLDHDVDPKESTIIGDQSTLLADRTLIGSEGPQDPPLSRGHYRDCEPNSDRKEILTTCTPTSSKHTPCSSSKYTPASSSSDPAEQETPIVYCRERKSRTAGVFPSLWRCVVSLLALISAHLTLQRRQHVRDVLQRCRASSGLQVRRAAECCVSVLHKLLPQTVHTHTVRSSAAMTSSEQQHPDASLWRTAGGAFRWLHRRWHHVTGSFLQTWSPLRLLLVLLPLLLLLSLCYLTPTARTSLLSAVSLTQWTEVSEATPLSSTFTSPPPAKEEEEREVQPLHRHPGAGEQFAPQQEALQRLELSLTALWERVEAGGQQEEQRHREVMSLYSDLQQQISSQRGGALSVLMEQQLQQMRGELQEQRSRRTQEVLQEQREMSRVDQLELQLQSLAAQTEELQCRQEAATGSPSTLPAAVSGGVDRQSHDALLAEVSRLQAALEGVRKEVEDLSERQESQEHLEKIQQTVSETVSAQVREEVRVLLYGNQLTVGGGASEDSAPSQPLLQWLQQQCVSEADLQEALSSVELRVLQNISLQHGEGGGCEDGVTGGETVTEEEVQEMVQDALRLFSQDRTGLADYALESGGGSILSTRCSETYETKAALLSLFGLPLWYFSQSPRAVIQPDVQPGNCWAFRGSSGFLVIRLSMRVVPSAFSLEHIPRALAPSGTLSSAPRDFRVYGLQDEEEERGKPLGSFTYDEHGEDLQTFPVTEENTSWFQIMEVQVLSNWGNPEYTCLYRFRVHGSPADTHTQH
ncbi:SUN domain-containing protein 1-like isoform X2 [Eleginops maclovinus]|uniref:SUN domain-containing protein 1-like isoform X2 n=1 Tax=Eleginops maclovinus TaxID=56733 RepID=UPI0030805E42